MVKSVGSASGRWKCKHEHCGVCGGCLLDPAALHQCNINTMSAEVKEIYELDKSRGVTFSQIAN